MTAKDPFGVTTQRGNIVRRALEWIRGVVLSDDVDLYLLLIVAAGCTAAGMLGLVQFTMQTLVSILLALIALLALSQVRSRTIVRHLAMSSHLDRTPRLLSSVPEEIDELRRSAVNLLMIGGSQVRQVYALRRCLPEKIRAGHRVRIVFLDPDVARLINGEKGGQERRIRSAIEDLRSYVEAQPDQIQIRTFRTPPSFNYSVLDNPNGVNTLILQHRGWKTTGEGCPVLSLTENGDGEWYRRFRSEAERIWDDALPYEIPSRSS